MTLKDGDVITGAETAASGFTVRWDGEGTLTIGQIRNRLAANGLPVAWAKEPRSPVRIARDAVAKHGAVGGLDYLKIRSTGEGVAYQTAQNRGYLAKWSIFRKSTTARLHDSAGDVVCEVSLTPSGDSLRATGDASIAAKVIATFDDARDNEIIPAGEVSIWLRDLLYAHCGATAWALGYYVPRSGAETARRLCTAILGVWGKVGRKTTVPIPIATSAELLDGLRDGFAGEVATIRQRIASGKESDDHGNLPRGIAGAIAADMVTMTERALAFRAMLGDERMAGLVAECREIQADLNVILDGASTRFALLEFYDNPKSESRDSEAWCRVAEPAYTGRPRIPEPVTPVAPPVAPRCNCGTCAVCGERARWGNLELD